jgi:hypothetical protein
MSGRCKDLHSGPSAHWSNLQARRQRCSAGLDAATPVALSWLGERKRATVIGQAKGKLNTREDGVEAPTPTEGRISSALCGRTTGRARPWLTGTMGGRATSYLAVNSGQEGIPTPSRIPSRWDDGTGRMSISGVGHSAGICRTGIIQYTE